MKPHRVSLTDDELKIVVAALNARAAGVTGDTRRKVLWLASRLSEMTPGNPEWILLPGAAAADSAKGR